MDFPPLRIVRFSGAALTEGIKEHLIDSVPVRVTNVAVTLRGFLLPVIAAARAAIRHPQHWQADGPWSSTVD
jgi:hypothetical protein